MCKKKKIHVTSRASLLLQAAGWTFRRLSATIDFLSLCESSVTLHHPRLPSCRPFRTFWEVGRLAPRLTADHRRGRGRSLQIALLQPSSDIDIASAHSDLLHIQSVTTTSYLSSSFLPLTFSPRLQHSRASDDLKRLQGYEGGLPLRPDNLPRRLKTGSICISRTALAEAAKKKQTIKQKQTV